MAPNKKNAPASPLRPSFPAPAPSAPPRRPLPASSASVVPPVSPKNYPSLIRDIGSILSSSRQQAYVAVNSALVQAYWKIGQRIVEFEQGGKEKAGYGSELLDRLSKDLKLQHGTGFSKSNIYLMRLFYLRYPIFQTVSGKLSWSHYTHLLGVSDVLAMKFYEAQCVRENWSVRQLDRQINSMLFERFALSRDKAGIRTLSEKGNAPASPAELERDPYVFEFLGIPLGHAYTERELEQRIIDNLQMFLLELGKGFAFVARQFRISLGGRHYYVDLVFYHRILKCFVLIDLKAGKAIHEDVGQMNLYLNYFKSEESSPGDAPPVGIIMASEKDSLFVKYALGGISNQLFVSRYKLYLPEPKALEERVRRIIEESRASAEHEPAGETQK